MAQTAAPLSEIVRSAVDAHRHERGPLLVILQDIQNRLRHIPPEAVPLLAAELNLSRADVHGVVSFYHDLRDEPAGRTILKVCRAEACQSVGADDLVAGIEEDLGVKAGQTTSDGRVSFDQVFCLGNCALGPSALIDGRVHGRLDRDRLLDLVRMEQR